MAFLLDTNVLSELRKGARCDRFVRTWIEAQTAEDLFVSVIALAEIREGIERLRPRDPQQSARLESWLEDLLLDFEERILPVTSSIAERWGRLWLAQPLPDLDRMIAATAMEHHLDLATRNVRDFERSGVTVVNPWEA